MKVKLKLIRKSIKEQKSYNKSKQIIIEYIKVSINKNKK